MESPNPRSSSVMSRIGSVLLLAVLMVVVRVGCKVAGRNLSSGSSANRPPVFFLEAGAVEVRLPQGWSVETTDPSPLFGPGLATTTTIRRKDGVRAALGAPKIDATGLPASLSGSALIAASLPGFVERTASMGLKAPWTAEASCSVHTPDWISCGGATTAQAEGTPWSVFFHLRKYDDDRWLLGVISQNGTLSGAESVSLFRDLSLE